MGSGLSEEIRLILVLDFFFIIGCYHYTHHVLHCIRTCLRCDVRCKMSINPQFSVKLQLIIFVIQMFESNHPVAALQNSMRGHLGGRQQLRVGTVYIGQHGCNRLLIHSESAIINFILGAHGGARGSDGRAHAPIGPSTEPPLYPGTQQEIVSTGSLTDKITVPRPFV
jgi:hypothetical protein